MTCIGASGPLVDEVSRAVAEGVTVASVLSGNRNFEGRIQPARLRLDTPREADYVRHGGVMAYVLRRLLHEGHEEH